MKNFVWIAVGGLALLATSATAQAQCVGDCDGNGEVAINELILGVNIALGSAEVEQCEAMDANGDGEVSINELITAVNNALGGCEVNGVCGDGEVNVEGETCDDGNNFGGDGCAANCTAEDAREAVFDSTLTKATVQTQALKIELSISGGQTVRSGQLRDHVVQKADGTSFVAGEVPAVIRAEELRFNPVVVPGLVCACVRGEAVESFGPGNAGTGSIGCGTAGLTDISYRIVQDHVTTPGSVINNFQGTPDDPECDDTTELPGGVTATACVEGQGEACSQSSNLHGGNCIGPRTLTRSGGQAPRGSALLLINSSISLLQDAGTCAESRLPNGNCRYPQYGPDCMPCTNDDLIRQPPNLLPTTTGMSEGAVFDANPSIPQRSSAVIDKDQRCFGAMGPICATTGTGAPFDCDALLADPTGGLGGGSLSVTFPSIDAATIGDNVTTTVFFNCGPESTAPECQ